MLTNIGLPGLIILSPFIFAMVMGVYSILKVPNFDENYRYAGFWLRFFAVLIDAIIVNVVAFGPFYTLGYFIGYSMSGSAPIHEIEATVNAVGTFGGLILGWIYYAVMESSKRQATFGKMALGLRVVDLNGDRISFGRASGRHFGKILSLITFFIGHFMAGWTRKKQALHDKMSGCLVVKNNSPILSSINDFATSGKSAINKDRVEPTLSKQRVGGVDAFEAEALRRYKAGEIDEETMLKLLGRDSI
jgi:uncharacterized RDD family membrane protein YckC